LGWLDAKCDDRDPRRPQIKECKEDVMIAFGITLGFGLGARLLDLWSSVTDISRMH
jgi:hypothetical protein